MNRVFLALVGLSIFTTGYSSLSFAEKLNCYVSSSRRFFATIEEGAPGDSKATITLASGAKKEASFSQSEQSDIGGCITFTKTTKEFSYFYDSTILLSADIVRGHPNTRCAGMGSDEISYAGSYSHPSRLENPEPTQLTCFVVPGNVEGEPSYLKIGKCEPLTGCEYARCMSDIAHQCK